MLGFDAILQLTPLAFAVEVGAALALRYHGRLLMGISFTGRLAGPTPWQVEGTASISLLFFSVSVHFPGRSAARPRRPAGRRGCGGADRRRVGDQRNWSGAVPREPAARSSPFGRRRRPRRRPARASLGGADGTRTDCAVEPAPHEAGHSPAGRRAHDRDGHAHRSRGAQPWRTTPVSEPRAGPVRGTWRDEQLAQPAFVPLQGGLTVAAEDLAVDDDAGLARRSRMRPYC